MTEIGVLFCTQKLHTIHCNAMQCKENMRHNHGETVGEIVCTMERSILNFTVVFDPLWIALPGVLSVVCTDMSCGLFFHDTTGKPSNEFDLPEKFIIPNFTLGMPWDFLSFTSEELYQFPLDNQAGFYSWIPPWTSFGCAAIPRLPLGRFPGISSSIFLKATSDDGLRPIHFLHLLWSSHIYNGGDILGQNLPT